MILSPPVFAVTGLTAITAITAVTAVTAATGPGPGAAASDPRPQLVERSLAGELEEALAIVERSLDESPVAARRLGLDYARADLLERLGRDAEADLAFAEVLSSPRLANRARARLAELRLRRGEGEVAAGLVATLVAAGGRGPDPIGAVEQLHRALGAGGDCRLLETLPPERLGRDARRRLDLTRAECAERAGRAREAASGARRLLTEATDDALAREAAELLARTTLESGRGREEHLLLARAAFDHREFELARALFREAFQDAGGGARAFRDEYALARCDFWLGDHASASARFLALGRTGGDPERRADALFQAGRALELAGREDEALAAFEGAARAAGRGSWAGAAELAALRLEALAGEEAAAEARLRAFAARRSGPSAVARGALYLAAGRLARGEAAGAADLLELAERSEHAGGEELAYWRGRLAELEGSQARAVEAYLAALRLDPFHPFARLASERLRSERLRPAALARGWALARASGPEAARGAALLLGGADPLGAAAERAGREGLAATAAHAAWLVWRPVPAPAWPLWRAAASSRASLAEDLLLALGRFDEAAGAVARHFPASDPPLAFTGAWALARAGAPRRALARVETLFERRPPTVPIEWVDRALRALLYPLPYESAIREAASERGVDPSLLAALLREESRFDPRALSPAAARGLAQLVPSTARELAVRAGLPVPTADDLFRPEVSIALGAAYLAELLARFEGRVGPAVAAYNAGEAQVDLWLRYCSTQDEAEFLSKVGFRETRAYLRRVLGSRAHYATLDETPGEDRLSTPAGVR